jgi:hypothetical protein
MINMKKNILKNIPNIEDILDKKSFEELTGSEKEIVLKYLSKEEYDVFRQTILNCESFFSEESSLVTPDARIKDSLLEKFELKKTAKKRNILSVIIKILNYKFPVYKIGFALSILALFSLLFKKTDFENTKYIVQKDTVFVEKPDKINFGEKSSGKKQLTANKPKNIINFDYSNSDPFYPEIKNDTISKVKNDFTDRNSTNIIYNIETMNNERRLKSTYTDSLFSGYEFSLKSI